MGSFLVVWFRSIGNKFAQVFVLFVCCHHSRLVNCFTLYQTLRLRVPILRVADRRGGAAHQQFQRFVNLSEVVDSALKAEHKPEICWHYMTGRSQNHDEVLQIVLVVDVFEAMQENYDVEINFYLADNL